MDNESLQERDRIVARALRLTDAERRSWSYTSQLVLALVLFALSPSIPGASAVFGRLTTARMALVVAPGVLAALVNFALYRRREAAPRVYAVGDTLETLFQYGINVGAVFESQLTWPAAYALCPFSAVFFGVTTPHRPKRTMAIMLFAHAALATAYGVRGGESAGERACIALGMGIVSCALYHVVAERQRRDVDLEAERRIAARRLNEARLDETRRAVARMLTVRIGGEIERLAREVDDGVGELEANVDARAGLEAVVNPGRAPRPSSSLGELFSRIESKCRRLCEEIDFEGRAPEGTDATRLQVDDPSASALLLVAQELVRNAVVRGQARRVRVELAAAGDEVVLRVTDDGVGLTPERLARATGGLENARRWLGEIGVLELEPRPEITPGTSLRVRLLAPSRGAGASSTFSA